MAAFCQPCIIKEIDDDDDDLSLCAADVIQLYCHAECVPQG